MTDGKIPDPERLKPLNLLIQSIKDAYKSTSDRFDALVKDGKITFDLLWVLLEPNKLLCTTCPGTRKPRCVKYDFGEVKITMEGVRYFELECRYLNFDGHVFGEVIERLAIEEFRGARPIDNLDAFPLRYHPSKAKLEADLVACGGNFVNMMGSHHRHYQGTSFFQYKRELHRVSVDGRIMIDAALFRKCNPNYPRLQSRILAETDGFGNFFDSLTSQSHSPSVKSNGMVPSEMKKEDLLICCPTVLGFSLSDKFWGETSHFHRSSCY